MSNKGTLYFFTGLAGAGKTTIGGLFYDRLAARKDNVIIKDGDRLRMKSGRNKAEHYTTESRKQGARAMFQRCKEETDAGYDVVCCNIAMYDEIRDWNRANIENYKEIYIKVSMETLYKRDAKGLYSSGQKNVVGIDLPYDEPRCPDFIVENEGNETPEEIVARIEKAFFGESAPI